MSRIAIRNGTVIDGLGGEPVTATVLVEGSEIRAVGDAADAALNDGLDTTIIDAQGSTVIPGLIDAHSHLSYVPNSRGPLGINDSLDIETNTINAIENAGTYLRHGVTSVLDVGTRGRIAVAVRNAQARGAIRGPRVVASGQVISTTGGLMNSYPEWVSVSGGNGARADDETEIRREVRRQSNIGVDNIKLGVTGQLGTNARDWLLLSREEIAVAVDEARRRQLMVAAHAYGTEAVIATLEGGVRTLHHAFAGLSDETLDLFAARESYLVPTAMAFIGKTPPARWPQASRDYYEANVDAYQSGLQAVLGSHLKERVATGSDSGISNPTATIAKEIVLFGELGLSPVGAIRAATFNAARALGIEQRVGSIEVGKTADICIVDGDIVTNLRLLQDPSSFKVVMQDGVVVVKDGNISY